MANDKTKPDDLKAYTSDVTKLQTEDKKPVPADARGVPVKFVRWERALQIPGKQQDDTVKTETLPNGRGWVVSYIPRDRHFQIDYVDPNRAPHKWTAFVHETRALSWEPLV
jgi:hypothetical protein